MTRTFRALFSIVVGYWFLFTQSRAFTTYHSRSVRPSHLQVGSLNDDLGDIERNANSSNANDGNNDSNAKEPSVIRPKRMIDLGSLGRYSKDEASELNEEMRKEVAKTFDKSVERIERMKDKIKEEGAAGIEKMREASDKRLSEESSRFMTRTDQLIDQFLDKTKADREATKMAAAADSRMTGKGLSAGVWGVDEYGRAVVTNNSDGVFTTPNNSLISKGLVLRSSGDLSSGPGSDAKVLFVTGDNPDENVQGIISRLQGMLSDSDFAIETIITTTTLARIGGHDASTCVIFPDAADDNTKMNQLVDRIRTATSSTVNGPPSHFVYVGVLGTTRTNEFPYSLQNMLGQLDKKLAAEESLKSTVKADTSQTNQEAADYTIIKMGKLLKNANKAKSDEKNSQAALDGKVRVAISPGDSLNGDILVTDAADVIYQSILLQPAARNATFSAVSNPGGTKNANQEQWDDLFVKLIGPELIRMDIPESQDYGELCAFVEEWARLFETSPTSKTGLTTPVSVSRSKTLPNAFGIEIKFKPTNTGDRYTTSKEDRKDEKLRSSYSGSKTTPSKEIKTIKPRKDGGVEVLVEQYPSFRIRARRCNMDDKTTVKEMSESSILKRLQQDIGFYLNRNK